MTTAVDTNVLLDVFTQDAKFCTRSAAALRTALTKAGRIWKLARKMPGSRRNGRMIADFLVAAHAEIQADCLLMRDRGFYRSYFSELRVVAPPEI